MIFLKKRILSLITVFLLAFCTAVPAAASTKNTSGGENRTPSVDPIRETEGYSAVLYDNTNGLPTSEANAIAATSEGFIWIGSYSEYELQFEPGSRLFVYTDGVPEAMGKDRNMFGLKRLLTALNEEPEATPEKLLKNVRSAVDGFVKGAEQFDDLTMLCMEYRGASPAND